MILIIIYENDLVSMTSESSDVFIETLKSINIEYWVIAAHGGGVGSGNDDNTPINMYVILYNNNTTIRHFSSDCTATFRRNRTARHPG